MFGLTLIIDINNPFGVDLVVDLESWSVLLLGSQIQFHLVSISVGMSIQASSDLERAPASGQWDWSPQITRSLDQI